MLLDLRSLLESSQPSPSVFESMTVAESVVLVMSAYIPTLSEDLSVLEDVTVSLIIPPLAFSSTTVADDVTVGMSFYVPTQAETVSIVEDVTVSIPLMPVSVFETVALEDATTVSIPILAMSAFEDVTITDALVVSLTAAIGTLSMSVSDTVSVNDVGIYQVPLLEQFYPTNPAYAKAPAHQKIFGAKAMRSFWVKKP